MKLFTRKILILTCLLLIITMIPTSCSKKDKTDAMSDMSIMQNDTSDDTGSSDSTPSQGAAESNTTDSDLEDAAPAAKDVDNTSSDANSDNNSTEDSKNEDSKLDQSISVDSKDNNSSSKDELTNKPVNNADSSSTDNDNSVDNDSDKSTASDKIPFAKLIVAIDAGHQSEGNYEKEPIGPGAKTTKAKVSSGTQGRYTGVPEYKLNLVIAKKVKEELINRGYEVVMIRETNKVNLSNKERADIANESGADIFIRIHADGSDNPDVHGTSTLYPSKKNPYVPELYGDSYELAKAIVDSICDNTGSKNRGAIAHDDMSGINWSKIPVTIIEMGYMTNKTEDKLMQTEDYQDKIVQGICDGIDDYFD